MKSYQQACGLAKALDVVGDRWALLIVRELMIRGACRYTDLKRGLPGIASNMLAHRLRELEAGGVVRRDWGPPPVATDLFRLTERGRALEPALLALGQWGAPAIAQGGSGDAFQPHWLVLPLRLHLAGAEAMDGVSIGILCDGQEIAIEGREGGLDIGLGAPAAPAVTLSGPGPDILSLFAGRLDLAAAEAAGVAVVGDRGVLAELVRQKRMSAPASDATADPAAGSMRL